LQYFTLLCIEIGYGGGGDNLSSTFSGAKANKKHSYAAHQRNKRIRKIKNRIYFSAFIVVIILVCAYISISLSN
jgi:hypothetical protein